MTVLDSTPRDQYTATSGQTVFPYTFEIAAAGDIKVLQNGTLINQGAGAGEYAVSGVGVDTGGNVTLVTGATTGDVLTIYRDMAYERLTAYTNAGDFLAADVNNDFDRLWLALQQNGGDLDRVLIAPNTDPTSIDMTIPDKATRLGKYLRFNDTTGNPEAGDAAGLYTSAGMNNYNFIGNGSTTAFTLGISPGAENNTQTYIDGVYQQKDTYTVSGTTLTFSTAPPNLSTIEVMVIQPLAAGENQASEISFKQAGSSVERNVQVKLEESVSVADFGAIGDGTTDDTVAIQAALNTQKPVSLGDGKTYKITSKLTAYDSIFGDSLIKMFTSSTNCIEITSRSEFVFSGFSIESTNTGDLFNNVAQGIEVSSCSNFKIENLGIVYFTDGISVSNSDAFVIQGNKIHEIGQELIAVRYSSGWSVVDNYGYNHNGDGILIKGNSLHGGLISGNTVKDGVNTYGYATKGGGITCNLEGGDTTAIQALSISNNIVSATSYGIALVGALYFTITGNKVLDLVSGKGIQMDEGITYNPNSVASGYGVIANNVIQNTADDEGIRVTLTGTVANLPCVISGNYVDINNSIQNSINAQSCTVSGNMIKGGLVGLNATDCAVNGNIFFDTSSTADAGIKLFGNTSFTGNVAKGWNNYIQVRADFEGTVSSNVIHTTSTQNAITILTGATGTADNNNIDNAGAGGRITQYDGKFSIDEFTSRQLVRQSRTAAPTSGAWQVGDIVWSRTPAPSGTIGWVCVTAGSPGTWKTFGAITA